MRLDPIALAARRQALIQQSDVLRQSIALEASRVAPLFALADGLRHSLHWLGRHKLSLGAAFAVIWVLRPRVGLRWARRAIFVWGICRRAGAAWQKSLALWQRVRG